MFERIFLNLNKIYNKVRIKFTKKNNKALPEKIKYFEGSLYDAILSSAKNNLHNIALEYGNKQITYKNFIKKINICAKSLKYLGVKKGDRVTICMPNTPEEVIMFYGINKVGAVANMIHPLSGEKEIEYYLNKSKSKIMLCIDISYNKIKSIINETGLEKVIICSATKSMERLTAFLYWLIKGRKLNIKETDKIMLWDHFINLSEKYNEETYVECNKNDPAVILYSGGTTGKPKGVVISNYSFNAQSLQSKYVEQELLSPGNSVLTFLPNFHAFGIGICTHTPLYNGMKVILIPQFNINKFKYYLRKYKFNLLCGVPTLYDSLTKIKFRPNELKDLKLVVCGGDAITLETKQKVNTFLKKYGCKTELRVGYGLTESSGVLCLSPEGFSEIEDVVGKPFPNIEFKIMDLNTEKEANIGECGEICISGPNLMLGYLDDIEETNIVLEKKRNKKAWLRTGDVGYIDDFGILHYKSRLKRMIIANGYNIYPSHIEQILLKHYAVEKCAVIGVKDEVKGEIPKAFIVLKENQDGIFDKSSIQKYLKSHLAKYELPKEIKYVKELPTTLVGKIAYNELEKL